MQSKHPARCPGRVKASGKIVSFEKPKPASQNAMDSENLRFSAQAKACATANHYAKRFSTCSSWLAGTTPDCRHTTLPALNTTSVGTP